MLTKKNLGIIIVAVLALIIVFVPIKTLALEKNSTCNSQGNQLVNTNLLIFEKNIKLSNLEITGDLVAIGGVVELNNVDVSGNIIIVSNDATLSKVSSFDLFIIGNKVENENLQTINSIYSIANYFQTDNLSASHIYSLTNYLRLSNIKATTATIAGNLINISGIINTLNVYVGKQTQYNFENLHVSEKLNLKQSLPQLSFGSNLSFSNKLKNLFLSVLFTTIISFYIYKFFDRKIHKLFSVTSESAISFSLVGIISIVVGSIIITILMFLAIYLKLPLYIISLIGFLIMLITLFSVNYILPACLALKIKPYLAKITKNQNVFISFIIATLILELLKLFSIGLVIYIALYFTTLGKLIKILIEKLKVK